MSVCLSVSLSVCLSVFLSGGYLSSCQADVCLLSACLNICLVYLPSSVDLSVLCCCMSVFLNAACLFACQSVCLFCWSSGRLPVWRLPACLPVCLLESLPSLPAFCLSVCLSFSMAPVCLSALPAYLTLCLFFCLSL